MHDLQAIDTATDRLVERGVRVLNAFLLAEDEAAHAKRLLELMAPAQGAVVLDAGCGVGELARLMHAERPDLTFKLLNVSAHQLSLCPEGLEQIQAPYEATGLPDESVDVVLFAFSLCHAQDWGAALREAYRVLRPGGVVFIFDMARAKEGSNTLLRELLQASAYRPAEILSVAHRCGLELVDAEDAVGHVPKVCRLREAFASRAAYETAMDGVFPITLRLSRMPEAPPFEDAFRRHHRIAFQFSGGRDSTAALYLLRMFWKRLDLYHLDTGDQFPETREVFEHVAADFAQVTGRAPIVIRADVHAVREQFGLASDLVPVDNTPVGQLVSGRPVKIIGRYECCARSLMLPMHARMQQDGITMIIRGQRDDEYATPPKRSGDVQDGIEVLYPIQNWSAERVTSFLKKKGLPIAPYYEQGVRRAPECMGCTAWWDEGRAAYMREHHPQAFDIYRERMRVIRTEIDRQYAALDDAPLKEISHG